MQKALFLFFFSLFSTLHAVEALPKLVTEGESLRDFDENFYLDKRSPVNAVAISPDGRYIVSGSDDNSVKIWDSQTGELQRSLTGHEGTVVSVAISEDGKTIVSGSYDNSIKIWDRNQTTALKSLIGGQRGTWLMKDHEAQEKRFYRGDDGTLLHKKAVNGQLSFALPQWLPKSDDVALNTKGISIVNDREKAFKVDVKNEAKERLYWIKNSYHSDEYTHILEQRTSNIDVGDEQSFWVKMDVSLPKVNPKPIFNHEVNLTLSTATGSHFNIMVPVSIRYAEIKVKKAELLEDGETLSVTFENVGNEVMQKAEVFLSQPFMADKQEITNIEVNQTKELVFKTPNVLDENAKVELKMITLNSEENQQLPRYEWRIDNVTIVLNRVAWYIYALWVVTGLVVLWLIWYLKRYRNTLVLQLQNDPKALLGLKPALWNEAREKLAKINELDTLLNTLGISHEQLDDAIAFDTDPNQAQCFAKRIPKSYLVQEGRQQKLACHKTELSVDDFLLCFTDENTLALEKRFKEDGNRIFVLGSEKERDAIAKLARDKTNNLIAPTPEQWSAFLLGTKPQEVMMQILAECLEFSSISPYQTSKGLNKEVDFFGRIKIVRDIKMNSKRNYMIVGGRQLGKSSILKKLERAYAQSASVDCRFINLEGKKGNIVSAMAENFGLESRATLQDIHNYISQTERKMLLLIDEVDEFIEPEIERDYETLKILKNLAEEGKASFVFAGYWTLYKYIVADYESPLYNFAELIVLEGLEQEACRELMIKPMQRIGLKHEDEGFLDEVIEACGRKANLIATICDEVLQQHKGKIILKEQLQKAMHSSSVRDKLLGWDSLETLDKIIIYLSVGKEQFEFDEVLEMLQKEQVTLQASVVKKSLERLVIAYILKREDEVFSYRVPLMKTTILKTNEKGRKALLDELVGEL